MGIEIEIYSLVLFFAGQKSMDDESMLLFYMRFQNKSYAFSGLPWTR